VKRTEDRLVEALRSARGPRDTATLARELGLHPNGVRLQLHRLENTGLVERSHASTSHGRPRDLWTLTPRAIAQADRPHTGWTMARTLARAIPATPENLADVRAAGAAMGSEIVDGIAAPPAADRLVAVDQALDALGFEPRREPTGQGARYTLRHCPYAEAVREHPAVVCTLHRGMIEGILCHFAADAEVTAFEPRDPDTAGCIVEIACPHEGAAGGRSTKI
jgi:predicted ArsR family transcriptional regulator